MTIIAALKEIQREKQKTHEDHVKKLEYHVSAVTGLKPCLRGKTVVIGIREVCESWFIEFAYESKEPIASGVCIGVRLVASNKPSDVLINYKTVDNLEDITQQFLIDFVSRHL